MPAGGFAGNRHIVGIAAEVLDISLHPFKRRNLIHHAVIDSGVTFRIKGGMGKIAERPEPIVYRHHHGAAFLG